MATTLRKNGLDPEAPEFFPSALSSSLNISPSPTPFFYVNANGHYLPLFQLNVSPHLYYTFNFSTHDFPLSAAPPPQSHSSVEGRMAGRKDLQIKYRNESSGGCDASDRGEKTKVWKECKGKLKSVDSYTRRSVKFFTGRKKKDCSSVEQVENDGNNTTVMIRNIPSKYTRDMLLNFLDEHCMKQNLDLDKHSSDDQTVDNVVSSYDFVYLPIDFNTGMNKGYAFVNFTSPEAMLRFSEQTNNQTWDLFHSTKIRQIAHARLQGKVELITHFENMGFPCESDEVLPVCFSPPRDGSRKWVELTTVGRRIGYRKYRSSEQSITTTKSNFHLSI